MTILRKYSILFYLALTTLICAQDGVYENHIVIYGEGPIGQVITGFEVATFSEQDAINIAKTEIGEFLSGMIYGYTFDYQLDNPITKRSKRIELINTIKIKITDPNFTFRQAEKSDRSLRLQGIYRLREDQINFRSGFASSTGVTTMGRSVSFQSNDYNNRLLSVKEAIEDAIQNQARRDYKSRPERLRGRLILIGSPRINLISGSWNTTVKIHLIISEVKYQENY